MPQAIQINSIYGLMLIHSLTCHHQDRPHPQRHRYHKTNIPISIRIVTVIRTNHRLVPVTPQGSSQLQSQSQNQYPYPYQQGQQANNNNLYKHPRSLHLQFNHSNPNLLLYPQ